MTLHPGKHSFSICAVEILYIFLTFDVTAGLDTARKTGTDVKGIYDMKTGKKDNHLRM